MKEIDIDKEILSMTIDDIAPFSKDQSTKVGAIIVYEGENFPNCFGYNGMPRGLDDQNVERNQRPEKYFWYEHAERNAIYNTAIDILEDSIMFSSHFPNMDSARAIVSTGIKKVVVDFQEEFHNEFTQYYQQKTLDQYPKHKEYLRVQTLFKETGVELYQVSRVLAEKGYFNEKNNDGKSLSMLRKYIKYLDIAIKYGQKFSQDEDHQAGALILHSETLRPIAFGSYMPPTGFTNITAEREKEKDFWFIEAEKNAIYNAVRPKLKNCSVYASWCPCMHCSLAIAAVGSKKVVTQKLEFDNEAEMRWKEHFIRSQQLFNEMGIETKFISKNELSNSIVPIKNKMK